MLHSMGVGRRKLVPFWVLALALTFCQHTGKIQVSSLPRPFGETFSFPHALDSGGQ